MKTRSFLIASAVSVGLVAACGTSRLAQQVTQSPQEPHIKIQFSRMHSARQVQGYLSTVQGDVRLTSLDGTPIVLTKAGDFFVTTFAGKTPNIIKVPMDMATMKISMTASGTVFEDAKNNKLTIEVRPEP